MQTTKLTLTNSALTVLKLIGISAMLLDHYNSFVKPVYSPALFELGRLALPLFVFVLGYNLARIPTAKMPSLMARLLFFGIISTPLYNILGAGLWHWWPLNILFTLLVATCCVYLLTLPVPKHLSVLTRLAAILLLALAASLVDYLWVGPALVVVIWRLFTAPKRLERNLLYVVLVVLTVLLCVLNDSLAALLALPVILLCVPLCQHVQLPRLKWFFYWFYPGHLLALLLLKTL